MTPNIYHSLHVFYCPPPLPQLFHHHHNSTCCFSPSLVNTSWQSILKLVKWNVNFQPLISKVEIAAAAEKEGFVGEKQLFNLYVLRKVRGQTRKWWRRRGEKEARVVFRSVFFPSPTPSANFLVFLFDLVSALRGCIYYFTNHWRNIHRKKRQKSRLSDLLSHNRSLPSNSWLEYIGRCPPSTTQGVFFRSTFFKSFSSHLYCLEPSLKSCSVLIIIKCTIP